MTAFKAYQDIAAVNHSTLKYMKVSPLHYRNAVDSPDEDTTRFGMGRAIHTAILQPERFDLDYVVFDDERRGNKWKAFKEAHEDKTILRVDERDLAYRIADRVRSCPVAMEWLNLREALIERPIQWVDEATGLTCKGLPDAVHSAIVDVKSTLTIDERLWRAHATRMGYVSQLAFYRRGYRTLTRMNLPCAIVAVELDAPHDVGVFVVDEDSLRVADDEISRLLAKVAECRKTGVWPGRYDKAQTLSLPEWARGEVDVLFDFSEVA